MCWFFLLTVFIMYMTTNKPLERISLFPPPAPYPSTRPSSLTVLLPICTFLTILNVTADHIFKLGLLIWNWPCGIRSAWRYDVWFENTCFSVSLLKGLLRTCYVYDRFSGISCTEIWGLCRTLKTVTENKMGALISSIFLLSSQWELVFIWGGGYCSCLRRK